MRKRRIARYVECFGPLDLEGLLDIARRHGMRCIRAWKPDMHVYNEIGLYGTSDQMTATERDWVAAGHAVAPRPGHMVFGVNLRVPRDEWIDGHKAMVAGE